MFVIRTLLDIKINDEYLLAWWSFETTTRVLLTRFLSKGPHIYYAFEDYLAGVAIALREIDQVINREKRKKEKKRKSKPRCFQFHAVGE